MRFSDIFCNFATNWKIYFSAFLWQISLWPTVMWPYNCNNLSILWMWPRAEVPDDTSLGVDFMNCFVPYAEIYSTKSFLKVGHSVQRVQTSLRNRLLVQGLKFSWSENKKFIQIWLWLALLLKVLKGSIVSPQISQSFCHVRPIVIFSGTIIFWRLESGTKGWDPLNL